MADEPSFVGQQVRDYLMSKGVPITPDNIRRAVTQQARNPEVDGPDPIANLRVQGLDNANVDQAQRPPGTQSASQPPLPTPPIPPAGAPTAPPPAATPPAAAPQAQGGGGLSLMDIVGMVLGGGAGALGGRGPTLSMPGASGLPGAPVAALPAPGPTPLPGRGSVGLPNAGSVGGLPAPPSLLPQPQDAALAPRAVDLATAPIGNPLTEGLTLPPASWDAEHAAVMADKRPAPRPSPEVSSGVGLANARTARAARGMRMRAP